MNAQKCEHNWEMENVARGLIVMKKCYHCGKISSCFCYHDKQPVEPCYEEGHFWNFMEGDPTFHFDLKCSKCDTLVRYDKIVGLMICTGCDERCRVDELKRKLEPAGVVVVIALGPRPVDERGSLGDDKIGILQDYFDQKSDFLKNKVRVVHHRMVKDLDRCYARVVQRQEEFFVSPDTG